MQWTTLARSLVPGDFLIMPFVALGILGRDRADAPQTRLRRRLTAPALIIGTASVLSLWGVGPTPWAVNTLIQDLLVTATFLGVLAYARRVSISERWVSGAVAAAGTTVSVILLIQGGYRPQATFGQPNMAAHFVASCFVIVMTQASVPTRLVVLPVLTGGVLMTSSFGALLSMGVVTAYVGYRTLRRVMHRSPGLLVALVCLAIAAAGALAIRGHVVRALTTADSGSSGLTADRLDQTGENRKEIWLNGLRALRQHPLGIGPGGFKPLAIHPKIVAGQIDAAEIHNDGLGYLVERGPIGAVGLVVLLAILWLTGRAGGPTRGLLLMTATAGFFRETLHFRHLWILMAFAIAHDLGESRELPAKRSMGRAAAVVERDASRREARTARRRPRGARATVQRDPPSRVLNTLSARRPTIGSEYHAWRESVAPGVIP